MSTEEHSTGLPQLALTFADSARPGPLIRRGALAAAGALPAAGPDSARSARFRTTARDTRRITTSAACVLAAADRLVCAYVCAGCRAHAHLPSSQHALKHRHAQEERVLKFLQRMRQNLNASGRQMLKIHLRRAFIHVQQCVFDKEKICDMCGANGDLYWLLMLIQNEVAAYVSQEHTSRSMPGMMHLFLQKLVDRVAADSEPPLLLCLSAQELMCMAN